MKRSLIVPALIVSLLAGGRAEAALDRFAAGARAQAMGGAFVAVADDGSAVFINSAGMVSTRLADAYLEYGEPTGNSGLRGWGASLGAPAAGTSFGLGWYRSDAREAFTDDRFFLAAARMIAEGTPGSFLSIGAGLGVARVSFDEPLRGAGGNSSTSVVTGDVGLILKPLPIISFGYSMRNVRGVDLDAARGAPFGREQRWGVAYYWENTVIMSFEGQRAGQTTELHYGLSVKTALPLELMAGFSAGSASGGVRWAGSRIRAIVSFAADGAGAVTASAACEISLYRERSGEGQ